MSQEFDKRHLEHLAGQFERGLAVLFTGAGFSREASSICGAVLPQAKELQGMIWELCFPGTQPDLATSLQDVYEHALRRHPANLAALLQRALTVDSSSLPDWYSVVFGMPWFRLYTLNLDDLPQAAGQAFDLRRELRTISGVRAAVAPPLAEAPGRILEVVHLNGTLQDVPHDVTFSVTQYADRDRAADPLYMRLKADLLTHPVVFVGTTLDEPPLWRHVQLRGSRGQRGMRELRPRSYLVTPTLDRARQALLAEYNVSWVGMTGREFAEEVLCQLRESGNRGLAHLDREAETARASTRLLEVAELSQAPIVPTDYLRGQEPQWCDLQSGRAIQRETDDLLHQTVATAMSRPGPAGLVLISGTVAAGKSTSLMRLVLRLSAEGHRIGWVDRDSDIAPRSMVHFMTGDDPPQILAIDDADMYGNELARVIRQVAMGHTRPCVLVAMRSNKIDRVLNPEVLSGIPQVEISMPLLTDSDIESLLDMLDRENRLGILKGRVRRDQVAAFKEHADRQLLVAMIQATSGQRFEEKAFEEFEQLDELGRQVYAIVAAASGLRFDLSRSELAIAFGDSSNTALNTLEQLARRGVIREVEHRRARYRARHRVIAEILVERLHKSGQIAEPIGGLARIAASSVGPGMQRNERPVRLLRAVINHEFLARMVGVEPARNLYGAVEGLLSCVAHFWLQRGSLEVEIGDLALAEQYLSQARGLAEDDPLVGAEWAYLLFRKAIEAPGAPNALPLAAEATSILEELMTGPWGRSSPYAYHILGSQGLAWSRRGLAGRSAKSRYIRELHDKVKEGVRQFPRNEELRQLEQDLKHEELMLVVPDR